jgi:hypothetical protein
MKATPLLALVLVFLASPAIAWLVLSQHWFQGGATAQGEWVQGQVPQQGRWHLLLPTDTVCDARCKAGVYLLHQSWLALGQERDRVVPMRLGSESLDPLIKTAVNQTGLAEGYIYIADPRGQLVLRYPIALTAGNELSAGEALLADLRKLLKLSRIG